MNTAKITLNQMNNATSCPEIVLFADLGAGSSDSETGINFAKRVLCLARTLSSLASEFVDVLDLGVR